MKSSFVCKSLAASLGLMLAFQYSNAQFGNILKKASDKLEQKANDAIDKGVSGTKSATTADTGTISTGKKRISMNSVFDFKAGDSVLYASNFDKFKAGAMPPTWKTNGSGQLMKSGEVAGTWLEMQNGASYKLNQNYKLPETFTVEFDLLTSCDKITDISPVAFGFAENNSVASFNEGSIAVTELEFYNNNKVTSFANPVDKYISTEYDLSKYANDKVHVSIAIDHAQMKVYLDKTKILDSKMFKDDVRKYFFVSAPLNAENDAKVYISNVVIAK
ncbi:hypothetical protein [Chitinophaga sp. Cy-1792]|uniref:hypothetical protein n=1 Tax=Chitinophaga sp. Cy-1792 TaxID=2608339 RepID=UPI0014231F04|nr:hypothetical protein [Chitinophaga sp. Cy-1792]NIG55495.1 hypothetical protein [Chitinophaga sp. Cy-1792]